jgi:hypothetical protein
MVRRVLAVALAVLAAAVPSAATASSFEASVLLSPGCAAVDGSLRCVSASSATSAVSAGAGPIEENSGYLQSRQDALASSGPGQLNAVANVATRTYLPYGALSPWSVFDSARASFSLNDILVTGPAGASALISFNIATAGGLTTLFDPSMYANTSVAVRYGVNSSYGGLGNAEFGSASSNSGVITGSAAFASGDVSVTGATSPWMVRAGDVISFSLSVEAGAVSGCPSFGCAFDLDAFGSALISAGFGAGPVALLPDGWTINSQSGLIVDNAFVGAPVPEPGTYALLLAGLMLLGFRARRRYA